MHDYFLKRISFYPQSCPFPWANVTFRKTERQYKRMGTAQGKRYWWKVSCRSQGSSPRRHMSGANALPTKPRARRVFILTAQSQSAAFKWVDISWTDCTCMAKEKKFGSVGQKKNKNSLWVFSRKFHRIVEGAWFQIVQTGRSSAPTSSLWTLVFLVVCILFGTELKRPHSCFV